MAAAILLVLDGAPGHQITTPALLLGAASAACRRDCCTLRICAAPGFRGTGGGPGTFGLAGPADSGGRATSGAGDALCAPDDGDALGPLGSLGRADALVVAGYRDFLRQPPPAAVCEALRAATARGCRMGAVGTGTFALAAAGLLGGRRATTDWRHTAELAARYPEVEVTDGTEVVTDGPFVTSSGVLGGKDLWLRLIEERHGPVVGREADRHLFLRLPGSGGVIRAGATAPDGDRGLAPVLRRLEEELHRPLTLTDLAGFAQVSVRTLNRRFRAETGLSPLQYLLRARVERAQTLLERGDTPVAQIASLTGLGTPANLRHQFLRLNGTTPGAYRAAFRSMVAMFTGSGKPQTTTRRTGGTDGGGTATGEGTGTGTGGYGR
ncbi:helix-turn-helix domain-containing protein [Streptomyces sp. NPDC093252]|uniref:GlxA family transcriptional regulator n=1 Tax=Streptomyces sp. NPDC093252 TaxID=3154980 RepID=UPI0034364052